jgi:hypothetical protein
MGHIEERVIVPVKTTNPLALTSLETTTIISEKVISSDWQRETEGSGSQSFYWCECPLDVSPGGSEDY